MTINRGMLYWIPYVRSFSPHEELLLGENSSIESWKVTHRVTYDFACGLAHCRDIVTFLRNLGLH